MPSGFQTDNNQLSPAYYRVVINMSAQGTAWYTVGNNDGASTAGRVTTWAWDNAESDNQLPSTQAISDALARGNMRFQAIVDELGKFADCQILDIENSGYNGDSSPDQGNIVFTVKYDRNESLIPAFTSFAKAHPNLYTNGTNGTSTVDGVVYDRYWTASGQEALIVTESDVVRELVYLAVARNSYTKSVRVFQPVEGSDPLTGEGVQKSMTVDLPANNTTNVFDNISVNEINGTSTTITYD